MSAAAAQHADDIQPGDIREGTGTHHVKVRVLKVEGTRAEVQLIRLTGRAKWISLATLRKSYRLVERGEVPVVSPC